MTATLPRQSVTHLPVDTLRPHPANIRDDLGDLTELAQSIRTHGIIQPLVVTEHPTLSDHWLLLAGHRRAAAAKLAGLPVVPCVIRHDVTNETDHLALMLVENCQRQSLGPIERAEAIQALINRGLTQAQVARATGMHPATIAAYAMLSELDGASADAVRSGELTVGDARSQIRAERARRRTAEGNTATWGRPTHVEPRHFTKQHPLATYAYRMCSHTRRTKVGSVACGQCWEAAIRDDALGEVPEGDIGPLTETIPKRKWGQSQPVDEVAVQRAIDGDRSVTLNATETREAVRILHSRGASDPQIGRTLGRAARVVFRIRKDLGLPANDNDDLKEETFA